MCFPIFIVCRDRLTPLLRLTSWLERTGQQEIYFVDNCSTFPPLLEFYSRTSHEVIRLDANLGHLAPWRAGIVEAKARDRQYVVSDPDIVPIEECPPDAIEKMAFFANRYGARKCGFGLKIDDLPDHYRLKADVLKWEAQWWNCEVEAGVFRADIDTTFAFYRAISDPLGTQNCLRTGYPYLARHMGWYINSSELTEEERYYVSRLDGAFSSWSKHEK